MKKKKYPELQMSKEAFENTLRNMLVMHELNMKMPKKLKTNALKLWGSQINWTLSYFDDFYEFLEHWEDYRRKK